MKRTFHICQSVEGALRNWKKTEWKSLAKSNNMSIDQLKDEFYKMHSEGIKVIPFGDPCEGFSYQTGCPGHVKEE